MKLQIEKDIKRGWEKKICKKEACKRKDIKRGFRKEKT